MSAKSTKPAPQELETFLFPTHGVSVKATSLDDALDKLKKLNDEVGDGNS